MGMDSVSPVVVTYFPVRPIPSNEMLLPCASHLSLMLALRVSRSQVVVSLKASLFKTSRIIQVQLA